MQQAHQDPTITKSPQRAASIRASSMPRLAVDPQVMKSDTFFILYLVLNKCDNQKHSICAGLVVWLIKISILPANWNTPLWETLCPHQTLFMVFWKIDLLVVLHACSRGCQQTASWWSAPSPPSEISAWTASGRSSTLWRGSVLMTHSEPGREATEVT